VGQYLVLSGIARFLVEFVGATPRFFGGYRMRNWPARVGGGGDCADLVGGYAALVSASTGPAPSARVAAIVVSPMDNNMEAWT
jgi:hypothetical protein